MGIARRDLFRLGAAGGSLGLLGALGWSGIRRIAARPLQYGTAPAARSTGDPGDSAESMGQYAARYAPPPYVTAGSRDALHTPPPPSTGSAARLQRIDLPIIETTLEVADGRNMRVWAYGGSVPGPILRARAGDRLHITVTNYTSMDHTLHFHGTHDVSQDGLAPIPPGEQTVYEITAGPFGLHPYHCHTPPYARHINHGMYGALIVDPPEGRPTAHELVLCLGAYDTEHAGRNDTYVWNGMAGYYERFPLKVAVGELVRLYVVNMVDNDSVASIHLHAQTFDVFRTGTSLTPDAHTDIVTLGPAERVIIEFRLPRRGRYMFHPHQSRMAERGAMGFITAV